MFFCDHFETLTFKILFCKHNMTVYYRGAGLGVKGDADLNKTQTLKQGR